MQVEIDEYEGPRWIIKMPNQEFLWLNTSDGPMLAFFTSEEEALTQRRKEADRRNVNSDSLDSLGKPEAISEKDFCHILRIAQGIKKANKTIQQYCYDCNVGRPHSISDYLESCDH